MIRESYSPQYGVELLQIRLPAPLKHRLHQYAAIHHQSMTEIVQEALEILLRQSSQPIKESGICGIWQDDRSAETIIKDIRSHRGSLLPPR